MARPKKPRQVENLPNVNYFKPAGIPLRSLEEVRLAVEEIEALRLKDLEGLDQMTAAARMKISRPTFQRILVKAREKVSDALFHGKAMRIEGGDFHVTPEAGRMNDGCRHQHHGGHLRIAVPTEGSSLTDSVGEKFGRCRAFLIFDTATVETTLVDNSKSLDDHNAGVKSARRLIPHGVDLVLAGECGPKALELLRTAGVEVITDVSGEIAAALAQYRQGA